MNRQWMDKQIHSFSQPRQHDAWEEMPCDSLKPTNAIPKEEEKEEQGDQDRMQAEAGEQQVKQGCTREKEERVINKKRQKQEKSWTPA